jgi:hypothetical protein
MRSFIFHKPFLKVTELWTLLLLLAISVNFAQGDGNYELSWWTINNGGRRSSSGNYVVMGTIGQPDTGVISGRKYVVLGGFWPGMPPCIVSFEHYAMFANHWLETDCDQLNNWCHGSDLNQKDGVDANDLDLFIDKWLYYCPSDWPWK